MLEPVLQTFEKLFLEFSWRRFFFVVIVLGLSVGVFAAFEWYTSYFKIARLEKTTELLTKLRDLQSDGQLAKQEDLQRIYLTISSQLEEASRPHVVDLSPKSSIAKFFGGSVLWLLFSIIYLTRMPKLEKNRVTGFVFALSFAIIFGVIGVYLPEVMWPWFHYVIYPILNFFMVFSVVMMGRPSA